MWDNWGSEKLYEDNGEEQAPWQREPNPKSYDFVENQRVKVQWPNGEETEESLEMRIKTNMTYDHGHTDSVSSKLPYVVTSVKGAKAEIRLDKLKVNKEDLENPRL